MGTIKNVHVFTNYVHKMFFIFKSYVTYYLMKAVELISYIFIRILVFLILLYIGAFIVIAFVGLLTKLNIYDLNAISLDLDFLEKCIDIDYTDILHMAGIVALLLLGILLMGIFRAENGIVVLPFEVDPRTEEFNGKVIAEMIIAELKRINRIHTLRHYSKTMWHRGEINLAEIQPNRELSEKVAFPQINPNINPEEESLTKKIETIGSFEFGPTSLPIGNSIILLKNICPGTDPGLIVTGCLRKYDNDISLAAYMKWKNSSWLLRPETKNYRDTSNKVLPCLVTDLSFQIAFEQLQSKRNDSTRNYCGNGIKKEMPSNWRVFKHFTEARESLQKYNRTNDFRELDRAKIDALKASSEEPYFNGPLYLLFYVGIAYLNLEKNYDAERLARYVVTLRPDSALVWYSWGVTLYFLSLDQEAIRCYINALKLKDSVEEHNMKADIYFMMARSLRNIDCIDLAIKYFLLYFDIKIDNGYVWGHFGIALEAKAKMMNNANKLSKQAEELMDQAEEAYYRAVELCPDFVSVHAALARIYTKKMLESNDDMAIAKYKARKDKAIELAQRHKWLTRGGQNEYNRACFEINCGNRYKARELLRIAIDKNQINTEWLKVDPDWENVKNEQWFIELSDIAQSEKNKKIDQRISEAAIRRKLDEEEGKIENFFSCYDIKDPQKLASKLIKADKDSNHLRKFIEESGEKSLIDDIKKYVDNIEEPVVSPKFSPAEMFLGGWGLLEKQINSKDKAENLEKLEEKIIDLLNRFLEKNFIKLPIGAGLGCIDFCARERAGLNRRILIKDYAEEIRNRQTRSELCENIKNEIQCKSEYDQARFYSVSGDATRAISLLQKLLMAGEISTEKVSFEPDFEFIRDLIDEFPKDKRLNS